MTSDTPNAKLDIVPIWARLNGDLIKLLHAIPDGFTFQLEGVMGRRSVVTQAVVVTVVIWLVIQVKSAEIQPFIYFQF